MSRKVCEAICFKTGHNMVSLVSGEMVDPTSKQIVKKYSILCGKCGLNEKQIQNYRAIPGGGKKEEE